MSKYYSEHIVWHYMKRICSSSISREELVKIFKEIPTADVEEVRHGKWVKDKSKKRDDGEIYDYCCSRCCGLAGKNDYNNYSILSAYCPHCGAKMDGE